jgi:putrescine transport system substrate-binding protein
MVYYIRIIKLIGIAMFLLGSAGITLADNQNKAAIVHIYNWADYILPESVKQFEKQTGIKVHYDVYESNQILETKLIAGDSGYDIVVPTASPFLERQIKNGFYQKIDKTKLKNYNNIDPKVLKILAKHDPSNQYSIPWMWGTIGIGYDEKQIKQIMPDAPIDSLRMIFDPKIVSRFAKCGVDILDSPTDVIPAALVYAGLDPNSEKEEDLKVAEQVLKAVRPYIRNFSTIKYISDLANGEICLAFGFSGDIIFAGNRAKEVGSDVNIKYALPKEGAQVWIDAMAVLKDAKNMDNAYKFLDFVLEPEVSAASSNYLSYMNSNYKSYNLLDKYIIDDENVSPDLEKAKLYNLKLSTLEFNRMRTRMWMRVMNAKN